MSSTRFGAIFRRFLCLAFLSSAFLGCKTVTSKTSPNNDPGELSGKVPSFSVAEENEELNSKERLAWLQGRKNYLKSLYQERLDPYFGKADEQVVSCEQKAVKLVNEKSTREASYVSYSILTTDAGATGVCDPAMQTHRMALVFAACVERDLQFTLKVICAGSSLREASSCKVSEQQVARYCLERKFIGAGF